MKIMSSIQISIDPKLTSTSAAGHFGRSPSQANIKAAKAQLKTIYQDKLAKIVPAAKAKGVPEKWSKNWITEFHKELVDAIEGGRSAEKAIMADMRGLTLKGCLADFNNELEQGAKAKKEVEMKSTVRATILKKLGLTAEEFKVLCKIIREEK